MPAVAKPNRLTLRAYQAGFGDCFLMTFRYPPPGKDRHVLIDFGSSGAPKVYGPKLLDRVAADISCECGRKLHIVVASHRHRDHINGFERAANGRGPGDVIRKCRPEIVLAPWTEDHRAAVNARTPAHELSPTQAYLHGLAAMQGFSSSMLDEVRLLGSTLSRRLRDQLAFVGETNLQNASAVNNLMTMGKRQPMYLYFGVQVRLTTILPGVTVHVLGPPTLKQSGAISQERAHDTAEFWHFQALASRRFVTSGKPAFAGSVNPTRPPFTRWIIPRLQASRGDQLLELVRILDDAMNNTSLILLFEVNGKKFLFPGDAQIENWSYALDQARKRPKLKKLLQDVDFYKVGHHGSLNATPKSLWALFTHRGKSKTPARLRTVVSTMAGKHGNVDRGTEVPRGKLIAALKAESDFFSTQELRKKDDLKKVFTFEL